MPDTVVAVILDERTSVVAEPAVRWALGELSHALAERNLTAASAAAGTALADAAERIVVTSFASPSAAAEVACRVPAEVRGASEAFALWRGAWDGRPALVVAGSDPRGLVYAALEVTDAVRLAANPLVALRAMPAVAQRPHNRIRSILRDFSSEVECKPWFLDRGFWTRYLTMLVTQRFNRFNLTLGLGYDYPYNRPGDVRENYLDFAYPFLVDVPGSGVRVAELADEERERNLEMLGWIAREAVARGLHFQLGLWSHAYHWPDHPAANYTIAGLNPDNHAAYCRDALRTLLRACPAIGGVTFRAHYESGIPEGTYKFWGTVWQGVAEAGRPVEIDIHAKGIDQRLIDVALATGMPVAASPKFWAEHMGLPYQPASIRELERYTGPDSFKLHNPERRFMRYSFGDLLRADRRYDVLFRLWPGTQRLLLWSDPLFAAAYSRAAGFLGSAGFEIFEPMSFKGRMGSGRPGGREVYEDPALRSQENEDWARHELTYRTWGPLLYAPDASPDARQRWLAHEHGARGPALGEAVAQASRILPALTAAHISACANKLFWPEIYANVAIVDAGRPLYNHDTPPPCDFCSVSPLDPAIFTSVNDYADDLAAGRATARYTPFEVAEFLERRADEAMATLAVAIGESDATEGTPALRRLATDVAALSELGHFFAEKLRAAVAYALYARGCGVALLREALDHYRLARDAWKRLVARTEGVYVSDVAFGPEAYLRGHWADRLPAIEQDLADMEARLAEAKRGGSEGTEAGTPGSIASLALLASRPPLPSLCHTPPVTAQPGRPVPLRVEASEEVARITLHYRHVNQAEAWQEEAMASGDGLFTAAIPAAFSRSPYALQYFLTVEDTAGHVRLVPGLGPDFVGPPYYTVPLADTDPVSQP